MLSILLMNVLVIPIFAQSKIASQKTNVAESETPEPSFDQEIEFDRRSKVAPDLEEKLDDLSRGQRPDSKEKVIIQLKSDSGLNDIADNSLTAAEQKKLFAREAESNALKGGLLIADMVQFQGKVKKVHNHLGLVTAELPTSRVRDLAASDLVEYVSPDLEIYASQHLAFTTGWKNPGVADKNDSDPNTWLAGGVGHIAVIDSGIDLNHTLLRWTDGNGVSKVKYSKDFTGQNITGDPYGHGSHVASMIAGDWPMSSGAYEGPAPASNLLSLRVLNSTGTGTSSSLISALDWVVANKSAWNIRVVNLSVGTPARDSYLNDPLCVAARRVVNAGVVVVASAGNYGKDSLGTKLYGSIGTPGIEPSVITVGAANTFGTDYRGDDTVATYSSRGPTRGYRTLANGARKYDNLIKPDLVAPGNKIIGARSYYNGTENYLARTYTSLRTGAATGSEQKIMYMSGTSMAAPIVAAAASLLLQTNQNLTPNLVKAILMYSAQPLQNANTLEQGAGLLNIDGAVRIARLIKPTMPTTNGSALLNASLPTSQTSNFGGYTAHWGKGVITNYGFLHGNDLMTKWQGMYANGVLVGDGTTFSGSTLTRSSTLTSGTLSLYQGAIRNNGVLVGDGTLFLSANAMGSSPTPFLNAQGVLVSDGVLIGDGVLVGDGVLIGDGVLVGDSRILLGDNTSCMVPAP